MRYAGFGPTVSSGRHAVNAGIGVNLDMQRGRLEPSVRLGPLLARMPGE